MRSEVTTREMNHNDTQDLDAGLYLVATPIGNLEDVSARALRILGSCRLVAAEDTRRIRKLLSHFDINKRVISYRDQNRARWIPKLIEKIRNGAGIALVSDAGMPTVSDPGAELVHQCSLEGLPVFVIPGPSAVVSALALSGFPADRFSFVGFPPSRGGARRRFLEGIREREETIVLFEAPHRILLTLKDLEQVLGDRHAAAAREMTKVYEEVLRGRMSEIRCQLEKREQIMGEFTVVIAGAEPGSKRDLTDEEIRGRYKALIAEGVDPKEALKLLALKCRKTRRELYSMLRRDGNGE